MYNQRGLYIIVLIHSIVLYSITCTSHSHGTQPLSRGNDYQAEEQRLALQIITTDANHDDANSESNESSGSGNLVAKESDINRNEALLATFENQYNQLSEQLSKSSRNNTPVDNNLPKRIIINLSTSSHNDSIANDGTKLTIGFRPTTQPIQQKLTKQATQSPLANSDEKSNRSRQPAKNSMRDSILDAVKRQGGVPTMVASNNRDILDDMKNLNYNQPRVSFMLNSELADAHTNRKVTNSNHETVDPDSENYEGVDDYNYGQGTVKDRPMIESATSSHPSSSASNDLEFYMKLKTNSAHPDGADQLNSEFSDDKMGRKKVIAASSSLQQSQEQEQDQREENEDENQDQTLSGQNPFLIVEGNRNVANFDSSDRPALSYRSNNNDNIHGSRIQRELSDVNNSNNQGGVKNYNNRKFSADKNRHDTKESAGGTKSEYHKNENQKWRQNARKHDSQNPLSMTNSGSGRNSNNLFHQQIQQILDDHDGLAQVAENSNDMSASNSGTMDSNAFGNNEDNHRNLNRASSARSMRFGGAKQAKAAQVAVVNRNQNQISQQSTDIDERVTQLMARLKLYTTKDQLMKVARDLQAYPNQQDTDSSTVANSSSAEADNNDAVVTSNEHSAHVDGHGQTKPISSPSSRVLSMKQNGRQMSTQNADNELNMPEGRQYQKSAMKRAATTRSSQATSSDWRLNLARNQVPPPIRYNLVDSLLASATNSLNNRDQDENDYPGGRGRPGQFGSFQQHQRLGTATRSLLRDLIEDGSSRDLDSDDTASQQDRVSSSSKLMNDFRNRHMNLKNNMEQDAAETNYKLDRDQTGSNEQNHLETNARPFSRSGRRSENSSSETVEQQNLKSPAGEDNPTILETFKPDHRDSIENLRVDDDEYTSNRDLLDVFKTNEKLYSDNGSPDDQLMQSSESNDDTNYQPSNDEEVEEIKAMEQIIDELVAREKQEQMSKRKNSSRQNQE